MNEMFPTVLSSDWSSRVGGWFGGMAFANGVNRRLHIQLNVPSHEEEYFVCIRFYL